jgi:ketosteroid isomerase-like protein
MNDRNRETMERMWELIKEGGPKSMATGLAELTTEDFVDEYPQSGELIRGRDNAVAIMESYPEATGTSPQMTPRSIRGEGDLWVVEGTIDYGDGIPVSYVGVAEMRDGKIARMTEYFGNPFPAPEWRAQYVERAEPATA